MQQENQLFYTIQDLIIEIPELERKANKIEYTLTEHLGVQRLKQTKRYKVYSPKRGDLQSPYTDEIEFNERSLVGKPYMFPMEKISIS